MDLKTKNAVEKAVHDGEKLGDEALIKIGRQAVAFVRTLQVAGEGEKGVERTA